MAPAKKPLYFWKGNTETLKFRFLQDTDVPLDLTGSALVLTIKNDGTDVIKDSRVSGWTITPLTGEATVLISAAETAALSGAINGVRYELERIIDGTQKTLIYGEIILRGGNNGNA